jgi:hypothetical protein
MAEPIADSVRLQRLARLHPCNRQVVVFGRWHVPYAPAFGWSGWRAYRMATGFLGLGVQRGTNGWYITVGPWVITTEPDYSQERTAHIDRSEGE